MKLRLGQTVRATDGDVGELADIIVDPVTRNVTHVVVEPHHRHMQARLVPVALVRNSDADVLDVSVARNHVRALQRVSFSEFVRLGSPLDVGDEWDIGNQTVMAQPYWTGGFIGASQTWSDQAQVTFDRIPKGECEIRRQSTVHDVDDHVVGRVEGLFVDADHVTAVVVRSGLPGFHRFVVVPLGAVATVGADRITLGIDRNAFDRLSSADDLYAPDGDASLPSPLQAQVATIVHHTARRARRLRSRLAERIDDRHHDNRGGHPHDTGTDKLAAA